MRRVPSFILTILLWVALACSAAVQAQPRPLPPPAGTIGVNKMDMFAQYTGTAGGGTGDAASIRVQRAMARKALADARDAGIRYIRVSMTGRTAGVGDADDGDDDDETSDAAEEGGSPARAGARQPRRGRASADSLALWTRDPQAFWRQVDEMMDDLDRYQVRIIPVLAWGSGKFPSMTGEATGDMFRNPNTRAWQLLEHWVTEFVTRYRGRQTILFYELTNELNNYWDLDRVKRCKRARPCTEGDRFSTADVVAYTGRFAALVRRLDNTRLVSSGFTMPRPSAEHLRARPEWVTGRPTWTRDSREQFVRNLQEIHQHVDIISIHMYNSPLHQRFGSRDPVDLLVVAKRAADQVGKPLFVGEFGGTPSRADEGAYTVRMIRKIRELGIPYSALWAWQFYQSSTYTTQNNKHTRHNIEPGFTDALIALLRNVNGAPPQRGTADVSPPRVVLTWPLPCTRARPSMEVHAVASDDAGPVQRVEFLVDGALLATDAAPPFSAVLDGRALGRATHRLTARAVDGAGNRAEFSSDVVGAGGRATCSVEPPAR